jgi:hypothetical protein
MQHTFLFRKHLSTLAGLVLAVLGATTSPLPAQDTITDTIDTATNGIIATPVIPVLQVKADQVSAQVSPMLYGLMTEEINFSYEGGLYGELVRNRTFKASTNAPVYWDKVGGAVISLDTNQPLNAALNVSLKLDTSKASKDSPVGIANSGYWGIAVRPNTTYHASFYAKGEHFDGPLTISLLHVDTNHPTLTYHTSDGSVTKGLEAGSTMPGVRRSRGRFSIITARSGSSRSRSSRRLTTTARTATGPTSCNCSRTCTRNFCGCPAAIIWRAITSTSVLTGRRPSATFRSGPATAARGITGPRTVSA